MFIKLLLLEAKYHAGSLQLINPMALNHGFMRDFLNFALIRAYLITLPNTTISNL